MLNQATTLSDDMLEVATLDPDAAELARRWAVYDEAFAAATSRVAELLRWVEAEPGRSYADIVAETHKAWDAIPPRPVPVTEAERAEAYRLIREYLAAEVAS